MGLVITHRGIWVRPGVNVLTLHQISGPVKVVLFFCRHKMKVQVFKNTLKHTHAKHAKVLVEHHLTGLLQSGSLSKVCV